MSNFENWYNQYKAWINMIFLMIQVSFFILVSNISTDYFIRHKLFSGRDIAWGIRVEYIFYEFVILFFVQCFFVYQFPKRIVLVSMLTALILAVIVIPYSVVHPFRVLYVGLEGFICVWVYTVSKYFSGIYHKLFVE